MFRGLQDRMQDNFKEQMKRRLGISEDYPKNMCATLHQMSITARVIDPKGTEAITRTHILGFFEMPFFCVAVEGKNIQVIEVLPMSAGGDGRGPGLNTSGECGMYYRYVLRANMGDREKEMGIGSLGGGGPNFMGTAAVSEPVESGEINKQPDVLWKGGKLADMLNADTELKNSMIAKNLQHFTVWANSKDQFMGITTYPKAEPEQWTDLNAFEIVDRIGQHIRSIVPR